MTKPLYVVRPEPGLRVTLETASALGLDASGCPLFSVEPVGWKAPDPAQYDGLLVGSSNVFRHGGSQLDLLAGLPVHAVGEATAEGAKDKGFLVSRTGKGGLQNLLDEMAGRDIKLLRLAGEAMVALAPPGGIAIDTRVVYRTKALELDPTVSAKMRHEGGLVLLHSGEAAKRLREECERLGLDRTTLTIAALGPRIAGMAGKGWHSVHTADRPQDADLLALAGSLCQ